ncbi:hypothetical protein M514_15545 [Trichuris suis]|uniref:Uncharacterized protein n=1 Tax=Trichuris suis TaxID=68888 RepID=A0A085NS26_9BILA|nr:hypothetical protein M514_15545 [Trichuris suis]
MHSFSDGLPVEVCKSLRCRRARSATSDPILPLKSPLLAFRASLLLSDPLSSNDVPTISMSLERVVSASSAGEVHSELFNPAPPLFLGMCTKLPLSSPALSSKSPETRETRNSTQARTEASTEHIWAFSNSFAGQRTTGLATVKAPVNSAAGRS